MSKLWFTLVAAPDLDAVTRAFRRNREEGMGERTNGRWLTNDKRKRGTLQVSRWSFRQGLANGNKLFVVITRQDSQWSDGGDEQEPYALTVTLVDRELANVDLYAEVRAILEARARVRTRARV